MRASELTKRLGAVAREYRTVYMWGSVGMPVTQENIKNRAAQYPAWYTDGVVRRLIALTDGDYWGFDCVNLIKAVLWGWRGDRSHRWGGAEYLSCGVPDVSADGMFTLCAEKSRDFTRDLPAGAALHCSGHIGVYMGDALAVECTPSWADGAQFTSVANIGKSGAHPARRWDEWGLLPWVEYTESEEDEVMDFSSLMSISGTGDNPSGWAAQAVGWAKERGIFRGDGEGNYGWDRPVSREALAAALYAMFKELNGGGEG